MKLIGDLNQKIQTYLKEKTNIVFFCYTNN